MVRALVFLLAGVVGAAVLPAADPKNPTRDPRAPRFVAGMLLTERAGRVVVSKVLPLSPAAQAGLLPGDTLLVVDDVPLIDLDVVAPEEVFRIIDRSRSPRLRLVVGRGAGTFGATLPLSATAQGGPAGLGTGVVVGQPAPPFTVRDLLGREVSLPALRGKPVLIDFWASWCPPCRDSAIVLRRLADQFGERLEIVGVSLDDDPKAFEAFVYNNHLPGHQVHDGGPFGPVSVAYGAPSAALPYSVLVSPEGDVVAAGRSLSEKEAAIARIAGPPAPDHHPE